MLTYTDRDDCSDTVSLSATDDGPDDAEVWEAMGRRGECWGASAICWPRLFFASLFLTVLSLEERNVR